MFYLMTHLTHFIYGYMATNIWLRTILIVRKETRCRHICYSFRLTAIGALAGTRNSSMGCGIRCQKKRCSVVIADSTPNDDATAASSKCGEHTHTHTHLAICLHDDAKHAVVHHHDEDRDSSGVNNQKKQKQKQNKKKTYSHYNLHQYR